MSAVINGYELDVAVSEEHSFESDVTQHPVEDGADVTDHIRERPIAVRLEGIVSDTPLGDLARRRGTDALPSDDAFARLLAIRGARRSVTIETALKTYTNMALQSLTVPRDARTGAALRFTALFCQLELVQNQRTAVRVAVPRGKAKVNRGNKASEPAPESAPPPAAKTAAAAREYARRRPSRQQLPSTLADQI